MNAEIQYAGFWARTMATVIDNIWLYGLVYGALWFLAGPEIFSQDADYTMTRFSLEWVAPLVVVMVFWIVKSATPGKMVFKMRIVDAQTLQPTTPLRLIVRYLAYFVSILPLGLGLIWVAWDKKKQGWHDKIAGTVVVRGQQA